jgi:hypothetical protein
MGSPDVCGDCGLPLCTCSEPLDQGEELFQGGIDFPTGWVSRLCSECGGCFDSGEDLEPQ